MKMQPLRTPRRYKSMDQRRISDNNFQQLAVPTAKLSAHQAQLKQALLAASRSDTQTKLKWRETMFRKKVIIPSLTTVVAVLAVLAISIFSTQSPAAYAEQVASAGLHQVAQLSPEQKAELDKRIQSDAAKELQAAKDAKDLQVLTFDQVKKLTPQMQTMRITANDSSTGSSTLDPSGLKYLRFTASDGSTHVIGLNSKGFPTMVMVFNLGGNPNAGTMQVNGEDGAGAGTITVGEPGDDKNTDGHAATSCSNQNGEMHCTTSGTGTAPNCQTEDDGKVTCQQAAATSPADN